MRFEEREEQPRRDGQHPPPVLHDEHVAVAVQPLHGEDAEAGGGEGRQDAHPDAAADGPADRLVAPEFERDPELGQRPPGPL